MPALWRAAQRCWRYRLRFGGWFWPLRYAAMLRLSPTTPRYQGMPNLHGLFSDQPNGVVLEVDGACLVVTAAWFVVRGKEITRGISAILIGGLLLSYHAFFGDAVMIVPATLLILNRTASVLCRLVGIFLLSPIAYLPFLLPRSPFPPSVVVLLPLLIFAAEEVRERFSDGAGAQVLPSAT